MKSIKKILLLCLTFASGVEGAATEGFVDFSKTNSTPYYSVVKNENDITATFNNLSEDEVYYLDLRKSQANLNITLINPPTVFFFKEIIAIDVFSYIFDNNINKITAYTDSTPLNSITVKFYSITVKVDKNGTVAINNKEVSNRSCGLKQLIALLEKNMQSEPCNQKKAKYDLELIVKAYEQLLVVHVEETLNMMLGSKPCNQEKAYKQLLVALPVENLNMIRESCKQEKAYHLEIVKACQKLAALQAENLDITCSDEQNNLRIWWKEYECACRNYIDAIIMKNHFIDIKMETVKFDVLFRRFFLCGCDACLRPPWDKSSYYCYKSSTRLIMKQIYINEIKKHITYAK